jgi:two-component system response regulator NreC
MKRFRILIADSHDVVQRSVRAVLDEVLSWSVVGEARSGPETLAKTVELVPDVVVLDMSMPGLNVVEVTREIARVSPTADVVVLTMSRSPELARLLRDAGAHAYLPKTDVGRRLVDVLQSLIDGRVEGSDRGRWFVDAAPDVGSSDRTPERAALTEREREVLQLLAEGQTNKEIGTTLTISAKTVETHRARIMSKLRLRSVGQLVRYAIRNRIINP